MKKESKEHILLYKILFSAIVLVIYIIGRKIPLYGVDISAYRINSLDAQTIFMQSMSGDFNDCSIFILGLWPYIIAQLVSVLISAIVSAADKSKQISVKRVNYFTVTLMVIIAAIQAIIKIRKLPFYETDYILAVKILVFIELIAGMALVVFMCDYCQKYGLGGRMSIFLANIYSGIFTMLGGHDYKQLLIPISIGLVEAVFMIILENTEMHIPVQRVSIHSIYSDKNYIAYKMIPVGIMPVMFASALFMLVQMIMTVLRNYFYENVNITIAADNMVMTAPLGMMTYLVIVCFLNITFTMLTILPSKTADSLLKSGDCLEDIYPGKPTKRYLVGTVLRLSVSSSLILCLFLGLPFYLQFRGVIEPTLVMLPSSLMMSTGIWITLFREAEVYRNLEKYRPLI